MSTTNLGIAHIAAAQNQPEVTANDALDALDNASNFLSAIANADADQTLTQTQLASGMVIKITGALTGDRHVNLPASIGRFLVFRNSTTGSHNLIVQVTGAPGSTVTISAAVGLVILYSDGTNVSQLTGSGGGGVPNFADNETPAGTIDGSNKTFTLANSPSPAASLILVQRQAGSTAGGMPLFQGTDYTLTTNSISMTLAPPTGDTLVAWYRH